MGKEIISEVEVAGAAIDEGLKSGGAKLGLQSFEFSRLVFAVAFLLMLWYAIRFRGYDFRTHQAKIVPALCFRTPLLHCAFLGNP